MSSHIVWGYEHMSKFSHTKDFGYHGKDIRLLDETMYCLHVLPPTEDKEPEARESNLPIHHK